MKLLGAWHATLFSSTPSTMTFRLEAAPGPHNAFQLKAKGPAPTAAVVVRVGDPCAGAQFAVTKQWSGGFGGAVSLPLWLPHQVTLRTRRTQHCRCGCRTK